MMGLRVINLFPAKSSLSGTIRPAPANCIRAALCAEIIAKSAWNTTFHAITQKEGAVCQWPRLRTQRDNFKPGEYGIAMNRECRSMAVCSDGGGQAPYDQLWPGVELTNLTDELGVAQGNCQRCLEI